MNLSKRTKLTLVEVAAVSAGTELTSDSVDMSGWEGVMFFGSVATVNAGNYAKAAQSSDDGSADDFTDLTGTKVVPLTNANAFLLDVYKPEKRYVRCALIRAGTNTATGDIYALQYGARKKPSTQPTTTDSETWISPVEGTA